MPEIFEDEAGGWRYRVKGLNGEIMVTSEAYTRESDARRGFVQLRKLFRRMGDVEPRLVAR